MPTYQCFITQGAFDEVQKQAIAEVVTLAHADVTGAPSHLAEIFLNEMTSGTHFIGGRPANGHNLFVLGHTRAGRSDLEKSELAATIRDRIADRIGLPIAKIWVYITEIPARQMIEFGAFLPEPGAEKDWESSLPAEAHQVMAHYK